MRPRRWVGGRRPDAALRSLSIFTETHAAFS